MTSAELWAAIALLALATLAFFVVSMARSVTTMANTLGILQKVDATIDDRVRKMIEAVRAREERRPHNPNPPPAPQRNAAQDVLHNIFGGSAPLEPVFEQPDADLEVVN